MPPHRGTEAFHILRGETAAQQQMLWKGKGACMSKSIEKKKTNPVAGFFSAIGTFFKEFGEAVAGGDGAVKASLIVAGAGYLKRKQIIKGILVTLLEIAVILYTVMIGIPYIGKLHTLGTVERAMVYNPTTMKNEVNDYDNSLLILLFGVMDGECEKYIPSPETCRSRKTCKYI